MKVSRNLLLVFVLYMLTCCSEAAAPVFVQAISSALRSVPFAAFPFSMSGGLTGAKLAIGGKLLYYLGLFGRGGPSKQPSMTSSATQPGFSQFSAGQGFSGGNFMPPQAQGASNPPVDPMVLMQALSEQGINPLQLMQALGSAGVDPAQMLQAMSGGGPGKRVGQKPNPVFPPQRFQSQSMGGTPAFSSMPAGMGGMPNFAANIPSGMSSQSFPPQMNAGGGSFNSMGSMQSGASKPQPSQILGGMPHDFSDSLPPSPEHDVREEGNTVDDTEDIESFFSFLKDMDDNKCISRLICDIGSDPDFLGEFTRNIDNIINSLDEVPSTSGAQEYMRILELGRNEGGCAERFPECDEDAYEIVKSVAPSVGVPGMNAGSL